MINMKKLLAITLFVLSACLPAHADVHTWEKPFDPRACLAMLAKKSDIYIIQNFTDRKKLKRIDSEGKKYEVTEGHTRTLFTFGGATFFLEVEHPLEYHLKDPKKLYPGDKNRPTSTSIRCHRGTPTIYK